MTATTVLGQRTKNTLDGRDADRARLPDPAQQPASPSSTARPYVARGAVNNAGNVAAHEEDDRCGRSRRSSRARGFSFVEILTMCPTGWFIETQEAPDYLTDTSRRCTSPGVLEGRTREPMMPEPRPSAPCRRVPVERRRRDRSRRCGSDFPTSSIVAAPYFGAFAHHVPGAEDSSATPSVRCGHAPRSTIALDLPKALGELAPNLRWVQAIGAGIDHLLDAGLPGRRDRHQRRRRRRAPIAEFAIGRLLEVWKRSTGSTSSSASTTGSPCSAHWSKG